jgi:SRSO17 transposase
MNTQIEFPGIDEYMAPYHQYFSSKNGTSLANNYVVGLMMDGERKSVEPMSERVNASKRCMQRLLTEVKWDNQSVFAEFRKQMLLLSSRSKSDICRTRVILALCNGFVCPQVMG